MGPLNSRLALEGTGLANTVANQVTRALIGLDVGIALTTLSQAVNGTSNLGQEGCSAAAGAASNVGPSQGRLGFSWGLFWGTVSAKC